MKPTPTTLDFLPQDEREQELRELVKAVRLFVENYRGMHARTLYAPFVEAAANRLQKKLAEV